MDILAALNRRYATKKFLPDHKISDQELRDLLEVVRLAPTGYGLQPFRVFVVTDEQAKQALRKVSADQPQIVDASHLLVFTIVKDMSSGYLDKHLEVISAVRNIPVEALHSYKHVLESSIVKQACECSADERSTNRAYMALGFLLLAAAEMNIDACAIENIDIQSYDRILGLKDQSLSTVFVCALGHRNPQDPNAHFKKIRRSFEEMMQFV